MIAIKAFLNSFIGFPRLGCPRFAHYPLVLRAFFLFYKIFSVVQYDFLDTKNHQPFLGNGQSNHFCTLKHKKESQLPDSAVNKKDVQSNHFWILKHKKEFYLPDSVVNKREPMDDHFLCIPCTLNFPFWF